MTELEDLNEKLVNLKEYMYEADLEAIAVIEAMKQVGEELRPLLAADANLKHKLGTLDMRKASLMETVAQTLNLIAALEVVENGEEHVDRYIQ